MLSLLRSPWAEAFDSLIGSASSSLVISSPYILQAPCERIISLLSQRVDAESFDFFLVTNLSLDNMLSGVTDPNAICDIVDAFPRTRVMFLPSLHAKVYVADRQNAVVTSANLTNRGLYQNFEYGVQVSDENTVSKIRDDVVSYGELGSPVSKSQLERFTSIVVELRDLKKHTESSTNRRIRAEFQRRMIAADYDVLHVRAANRAPHAIFGDAILYVLQLGGCKTVDLHREIQRIHPDLCDDSVERIIDGKRFGKKWKHAVRTAQQNLKKKGLVEYRQGKWWLV